MQLTSENYYSQEANQEYMSVSGYKDFAGTYGKMPCEFYGMEKLNGRWEDEKSTALLVGSYVDSYFEGSLEQFKKDNPEIFTQKGELKANFKQAEEIIARIERDEYFMKYMSGQKQVIMTGELFGAKWKIKMDSYIPGVAIVDLKVMASITDLKWVPALSSISKWLHREEGSEKVKKFSDFIKKSAEPQKKEPASNVIKGRFKIAKSDDDKHLAFGWANVAIRADGEEIEDWQEDIIEPEELENAAYQYVLLYREGGEMHERGGAAVLVESVVFTEEKMQAMGIPAGTLPIGWWIGFKVTDEDVWEKVKDGTYPMFSIEGEAERVEVEDENTL